MSTMYWIVQWQDVVWGWQNLGSDNQPQRFRRIEDAREEADTFQHDSRCRGVRVVMIQESFDVVYERTFTEVNDE